MAAQVLDLKPRNTCLLSCVVPGDVDVQEPIVRSWIPKHILTAWQCRIFIDVFKALFRQRNKAKLSRFCVVGEDNHPFVAPHLVMLQRKAFFKPASCFPNESENRPQFSGQAAEQSVNLLV